MSVSRSPVAALFPRRPSSQSLVSANSQLSDRSVPVGNVTGPSTRDASPGPPEQGTTRIDLRPIARPVSPVEPAQDAHAGLRRNVSSGIAKRFQALAETSNAQDNLADRKLRAPHRTRTSAFRNRWGMGDRAGSAGSATTTSQSTPTWTVSQDPNGNRDSINVRARIVRPSSALPNRAEKPAPEEAPQLQKPKIEVSTDADSSPADALPSTDTIAAVPSVRSPTRVRPPPFAPQAAVPEDLVAPAIVSPRTAVASTNEETSTIGSKSDSRASRFFKRMSSLGGSKRRSTVPQPSGTSSSPVTTDTPASTASARSIRTPSSNLEQDKPDMPPAAALGVLDVQFPDTLVSLSQSRV